MMQTGTALRGLFPGACIARFGAIIAMATMLAGMVHPIHAEVPQSRAEITRSFVPVVKRAAPAVVSIYTRKIVARRASPFAGDPFFDQLFGSGPVIPRVEQALGSGVVVDAKEGLVVSNWHVVGEADQIRVVLADRREFDAEIVLGDPEIDLAVLRLKDAHGLAAIPLRDSDAVEVGELVLAIGNPFGVGQTVSSGIVSGLARSGAATGNLRGYFIQTDAPINPGNSGGALVDNEGRLIGINTAILTRSGGSNGVGFAIPSNLVRVFVEAARRGERHFERPWAGMIAQAVDQSIADGLAMARPEGVIVTRLHPASPFAEAGLRPGDVILRFDGRPVNAPAELLFRMTLAGNGRKVPIIWLRDGEEMQGRVRMMPPPDTPPAEPERVPPGLPLAGSLVANVNPKLIARHNLPLDAAGVVILEASPISARLGLRAGDIIRRVNGYEIERKRDLLATLSERTRWWRFDVERGGHRVVIRARF